VMCIVLLVLVIGILIWSLTAGADDVVPPSGEWEYREDLSGESFKVEVNESSGEKKMVISGNWDKRRLSNGSLVDNKYDVVENGDGFEVGIEKFDVKFGKDSPSVNLSYKDSVLSFSFVGYGLWDYSDDDIYIGNNVSDVDSLVKEPEGKKPDGKLGVLSDGKKLFDNDSFSKVAPSVDSANIHYSDILKGVDIYYNVTKSGVVKMIVFKEKLKSIPSDFDMNNTYIGIVEKIDGLLPDKNESWDDLLFGDLKVPREDNVFKKVIDFEDGVYLLTAVKYEYYANAKFPLFVDPSLEIDSSGDYCGVMEGYDVIEITDGATVSLPCGNCSRSSTNEPPPFMSDCTWVVNATERISIETGSKIDSANMPKGWGYNEISGTGGGRCGVNLGNGAYFGADCRSATYANGGDHGDGGYAYNSSSDDSVNFGSTGGSAVSGSYYGVGGGNGGSGVYLHAPVVEVNGSIDMNGGSNSQCVRNTNNLFGFGGGSGGGITIRADLLVLENTVQDVLSVRGSTGGPCCDFGGIKGYPGNGGDGGRIKLFYNELRLNGSQPAGLFYYNVSGGKQGGHVGGSTCFSVSPNEPWNGVTGSIFLSYFALDPVIDSVGQIPVSGIGISDVVTLQVNLSSNVDSYEWCYCFSCEG